jgi:hypothetical protein
MNSRRIVLGCGAALACGLFVVVLRVNALAAAREDAARELQSLGQTTADLREWSDLRTQREVVSAAKRPTQDVIAQVNAVLRDAGIPTERLKGLEPESDVALAGRYRTQTIRLALERVTLREVGSFLAAWRAARTVWTLHSIELTQVVNKDGSSGGLDARIVIAATYLSDSPPEPPR